MTISTTANRISYAGDDSTTPFSFPYKFFANDDLEVILTVVATAVSTTQILDTDYTVTGAGNDAGGTVTMTTAPATGETLVIIRNEQFTQGLDLVENDPFPSDLVEQQFDILTMLTQQLDGRIDRSFTLADGDVSGASLIIPTPVANELLGWNSGATALEGKLIADLSTTPVSAYMATLLDDSNATEAQQTLELEPGVDIEALDADILRADTNDTLTAGFAGTDADDGTQSSGTYTPIFTGGNYKKIVNGGAFTLAPMAATSSLRLQITNNASAGAITTSGWSDVVGTFTTTDGDDFMCWLEVVNGFPQLTIRPLQ